MIERFQGEAGKRRLRNALCNQRLVAGNESVATLLADVVQLSEITADSGSSVVIQQGGSDTDLYLILCGSVSVRINGQEVAVRSAGQHVGEISTVDPTEARTASVVVRERSVLARVSEEAFERIADAHPRLWRYIARELAVRLKERSRFIRLPNVRPIVFIGSSRESMGIAEQLKAGLLSREVEARVWSQGVFQASQTTIESLEQQVASCDFAVLVLAAEDMVESRGVARLGPRDNCIFELGLFMGQLGRRRTIMVRERGKDIKIPTDLLGVTSLEYDGADQALVGGSLETVCSDLRRIVLELGPRFCDAGS